MSRPGKNQMTRFFSRLISSRRGSITVEAALSMTALFVLLLGIIDFGMAYNQKMGIENAVKAGIQYSSVKKPNNGDLSGINNTVITAAPTPSPGPNVLTSRLFCECANGVSIACLSSGGVALVCPDGSTRRSFVTISLSQSYKLLIPYPAFGSNVTLSNTETVRLN